MIPLNEPGPLVVNIEVPGCLPVTQEVQLTGQAIGNATGGLILTSGGGLTITAPTTVSLGESFQILITTPNGPEQWVNVRIVGPEGYTFTGTTDQYGIVRDSYNKIFGVDIKPEKTGVYQVFANKEGFSPTQFTIEVIKKECPFECCPENSGYQIKLCEAGYECNKKGEEYVCEPIQKPYMRVTCDPKYPRPMDEIKCTVVDENGNKLEYDFAGTLMYGNENKTLLFKSGEASFSLDKPGEYRVIVPDSFGYEGDTFRGEVTTPRIPLLLIILLVVVILIVFLIIILKLRKGGKKESLDIVLEKKPPSIETVTTEK